MTELIPRLLTTPEVSEHLRVSVSFLMKARLKGDGPRYRKVGRCVRYAESDLLSYLKQNGRTSTSEQ